MSNFSWHLSPDHLAWRSNSLTKYSYGYLQKFREFNAYEKQCLCSVEIQLLQSWIEWGQVRGDNGRSLEYGRSLRKLMIWKWVVAHNWIYISVFSLCLDLPWHQLLSTQHTESGMLYLLSGHLNLPKILHLVFRVFSLSIIRSILCHGLSLMASELRLYNECPKENAPSEN